MNGLKLRDLLFGKLLRVLSLFTFSSIFYGNLFGSEVIGRPPIVYPNRHIVFQSGKLNHKPWDLRASYGAVVNFNSAVFTKVVYIDSKFKIHPGLFKSWSWDFKNNSFTFKLDTTKRFSEDRPVTPVDVEFAFVKLFLSQKGVYASKHFIEIFGSEKLENGQNFKSGMCEGVKIVGKDTLVIKLKKSDPEFIYSLEENLPVIAPVEDFKGDLYSFKRVPRGSGSYKVVWSSSEDSSVRLERKIVDQKILSNTKYPLSIDFLNKGEPMNNNVDIAVEAGSHGIRDDERYITVLGRVPNGINRIEFNYNTILGKNELFRKAISLALDRGKIFESYNQMKSNHEMIPSIYPGRSNNKFSFDPALSKKIIKENFDWVSSSKKPVKAIYQNDPRSKKKKYIVEIERQLKEVGLYVNFEGSYDVNFNDDKDYIIKEVGYGLNFVDPLGGFIPYINVDGQYGRSMFNNKSDWKALLKLFKKAQNSADRTEKLLLVQKLSDLFMSKYLTLPLAESTLIFTYGKKIKSIGYEELNSAINFDKIELK